MQSNNTVDPTNHQARHPIIWLELAVLFIGCPFLLGMPVSILFKLGVCALALIYSIKVAHTLGVFKSKPRNAIPMKLISGMGLRFALFAAVSTLVMWVYAPENLFYVPINNPSLWIKILFVYTFISVIPQEFLYRSFFFTRYQPLFKSHSVFVFVSAIIFSFAHFFLHNTLVFALTFCGGLLFTYSYNKHGRLWLVSLEHSAYGLWLFTIGIGDKLAFPGAPS